MRLGDAQLSWGAIICTTCILASLASSACDSRSPADGSAAGSGEGRVLPARIVSTMPSTTEMLHAIGVWDRVVGVSRFCDVPPEASRLPRVGSGMDPDLERMLSMQPDLVVGTIAQQGFPFVAALEQAGIPVLLVTDRSLDEMYEGLIALGRAVGAEDAARQEVTRIRTELAEIRRRADELEPIRVLAIYDYDPIYAAGPDTLMSRLLEVAGGRNVLQRGDWVQLDRERVLRLAPEAILGPVELDAGALLESWAALATVPAVRNRRVYSLQSHGVSRPGPGAPEAAREIAERLHPGHFAPVEP